jgi:hypothetical protein
MRSRSSIVAARAASAAAIRSADHSAHPYNIAMLPVIDWYFGKAARS